MESAITLTVNGQKKSLTTDPARSLLEILRENLHLLGTRFGCGAGDCGACTVHIDGKRAFACQTPAAEADGKSVTTIEGLAHNDRLHPLQQAFMDEGAYQCGYCVSGMIMAAAALLQEKPNPSDADIRQWMNPNLCRCCGYVKIVSAIRRAAGAGR
ncbi:MAG TPA: (2Fe-2S)-binding protein [Tepidisphaeraceae bacterium]|jgi:aerobic-type carbon monoxide dehydrogenase small subunit (CoxS/CutS family)|nr:(2Fe-2S)-binding protein [Tepidisphaeraceae bacterium]